MMAKIEAFAADPILRTNAVKFFGSDNGRIRQGDFRASFVIDGASNTLQIVTIGNRREIYR